MSAFFAKLLTNRRGWGAMIGITVPFLLEVGKQAGVLDPSVDTSQTATTIASVGAGLLSLLSLFRPKAQ